MTLQAIVTRGWFLAQETGVAPDASTTIGSLIVASPFAGVLLYLLLNERTDRKQVEKDAAAERAERDKREVAERTEHKREMAELRAEVGQMFRELVPAVTQSTDVLKDVQVAMSHEVEAARTRQGPGIERRLDELIETLRSQR